MHLHMQMNEECGAVWGCEGLYEASPPTKLCSCSLSPRHTPSEQKWGATLRDTQEPLAAHLALQKPKNITQVQDSLLRCVALKHS